MTETVDPSDAIWRSSFSASASSSCSNSQSPPLSTLRESATPCTTLASAVAAAAAAAVAVEGATAAHGLWASGLLGTVSVNAFPSKISEVLTCISAGEATGKGA